MLILLNCGGDQDLSAVIRPTSSLLLITQQMPVNLANLLAPNIYVFDDFCATVQLSYAVQPKELKAQFDGFIRARQLARQSQS